MSIISCPVFFVVVGLRFSLLEELCAACDFHHFVLIPSWDMVIAYYLFLFDSHYLLSIFNFNRFQRLSRFHFIEWRSYYAFISFYCCLSLWIGVVLYCSVETFRYCICLHYLLSNYYKRFPWLVNSIPRYTSPFYN